MSMKEGYYPTIGMACVMLTLQKLQKAFKNLQYLHHVHKVLRLQPLPAHVIGQSSTLKAEKKPIFPVYAHVSLHCCTNTHVHMYV